jgi:RNA polymerase sigma factor FliA
MNLVYNKKQLDYSGLIKEYMPLVKKVSLSIHKKINFTVELDDLIQSGYIGLMEALKKYVPTDNAKFETYAITRIKGSILDDLRKNDHLSQDDRSLFRKIEESTKSLIKNQNKKPTATEIAEDCGISIEDYFHILNKNHVHAVISFEDTEEYLSVSNEDNIEENIRKKQLMKMVAKEISNLNEKEQILMQLLYVEDLDAKEAAYVMEITPARVSQMHTKILQQLKINLADSV